MDRKHLVGPQMDRSQIRSPPERTATRFALAYHCGTRRLAATLLFGTFRFRRARLELRNLLPKVAGRVRTRSPLRLSKRDSNGACKPRECRARIPAGLRRR